jgi:hypothetical protein
MFYYFIDSATAIFTPAALGGCSIAALKEDHTRLFQMCTIPKTKPRRVLIITILCGKCCASENARTQSGAPGLPCDPEMKHFQSSASMGKSDASKFLPNQKVAARVFPISITTTHQHVCCEEMRDKKRPSILRAN